MPNITAKEFESLKKRLLSLKQDDLEELKKIREALIDKSADANSLKLCELFNTTLQKSLNSSEPDLTIDTDHVKALIQLRKTSVYIQSILVDCQQASEKKAYFHQIDLGLLKSARAIVEKEEDPKKRQFYAEYFNYDIISHLVAFDPSFENELIILDTINNLLVKTRKDKADHLIH